MKLINYLAQKTRFNLKEEDVESIFTLDDEATLETILVLHQEESSDDEFNDFFKVISSYSGHPIPLAPVTIFPKRYSKPIKVITLFDTDATQNNP